MWPGPRPTSVPSGILNPSNHLATIHQCHRQNVAWAEAYLCTKWYLESIQPFGHNTPMSQTDRRRQTEPRSDSIAQQVLSSNSDVRLFGHNRHGPKSRGLLCPFLWGIGESQKSKQLQGTSTDLEWPS